MATKISKNYTSDTFGATPSIDDKIRIFEDREIGWRFEIAAKIEAIPDSGYCLVSSLVAYFEMIAQYISGTSSKSASGAFFRAGVRDVYPSSPLTDPELDEIYSRVRCGMFHGGYTKLGALLGGGFTDALSMQSGNVCVNPHRLLPDLKAHFERYIKTLRNTANTSARTKFEKIFDKGTT